MSDKEKATLDDVYRVCEEYIHKKENLDLIINYSEIGSLLDDDELRPEIVFYNDHSHVPDQYLPKRNRIVDFLSEEEDKKQ